MSTERERRCWVGVVPGICCSGDPWLSRGGSSLACGQSKRIDRTRRFLRDRSDSHDCRQPTRGGGTASAALHGLIEPGAHAIEVIRSAPRRKTLVSIDRPGTHRFTVLVHCTRRLPARDVALVSGIPVTSVARTLVDLAGCVAFKRLRSALLEAERLRILPRPELDEVLGRGKGWSGVRNLRQALADMDPDDLETRSELEVEMLRLCRNHVEVDGYESHGAKPAFRSDRNRDVRSRTRTFCRIIVGSYVDWDATEALLGLRLSGPCGSVGSSSAMGVLLRLGVRSGFDPGGFRGGPVWGCPSGGLGFLRLGLRRPVSLA